MFHSAALKLTLWYLGIIMLLSICFSVAVYDLSSHELIHNTQRQNYFLTDRLPQPNFNNFNRLRSLDLNEGQKRLKANLAVFNVLVFIAGGAASYALARRTLQPIEEALEAQQRFTGDASHELRTPLTIMQTETEVALRQPQLTKQAAIEQLKSNLEEVAKLKTLSDGLLKLASFDRPSLSKNRINLRPLVEAALDRWRKAAELKNIIFDIKLQNAYTAGDGDSLTELVSVLIDNAIKYSADGSRIGVSLVEAGKTVRISIKDDGEGISSTDLPKIFDRFYQTDASRSSGRGYGLGLSIARRIAELHNGAIEVKSAPGAGSTFTAVLPSA